MPEQQISQQLSQLIERDVRQTIGDLQMQVIILKNMLDMQGQPKPGQPQPNPTPQPGPDPQPAAFFSNGRGGPREVL
jgi:hypothetical protein